MSHPIGREPFGYVLGAIDGFLMDPPDSDFQRGYLAALITVMTEGFVWSNERVAKAAKLINKEPS